MKKVSTDIVYKAIQILESIILVILGVIICIFSGSESLQNAIGYCVAFILMIFGLFTIAFSYLFSKGISSLDTTAGTFLLALGALIMINPQIVTEFVPLFLGILLIVYGVICLIEVIAIAVNLKFNKGLTWKLILYILLTIILMMCGILIIIFLDSVASFINILLGVILIILGIILFVLAVKRVKKKSQSKALTKSNNVRKKSSSSVKSNNKKQPEAIDVIDINQEESEIKQIDTSAKS